MALFAVIRTQGSQWLPNAALEDQPQWLEHADFMDGLQAEGLVVLGGPLEGTPEILLVMCADSAATIRKRLDGDPWTELDLLRVQSIRAWTLRLGTIAAGSQEN